MERQEYFVPPNDLSDLVHFIFNNLSPLSLPSMANEFREAVSHAYLPWMAQYLVKRAGIEPNLHSLYMAFIDYLEDMPLFELVLQETYSQIREILLADRPFTGPSLKNLGHWLGLQTLARDKGVSSSLLLMGDLLCVLSFVSKLLGHSAHSRIFQPSHHTSYSCWVNCMHPLALTFVSVWR